MDRNRIALKFEVLEGMLDSRQVKNDLRQFSCLVMVNKMIQLLQI